MLPDVMAAATTYFVISGLSYPFLSIYDSGCALFRSMGNSRIPLTVSIGMNLINLVGNTTAIFVLHTGVAGVAMSYYCTCNCCSNYNVSGF